MEGTGARVTQRAPQSCQRCFAKKIRCSRTIPCDACISQNIASDCRRESVIITKQIRSSKLHQRRKQGQAQEQQYTHRSHSRTTRPQDGSPTYPSPSEEDTAAMLVDFAQQGSEPDMSLEDIFNDSSGTSGATPRTPPSQGAERQDWPMLPEVDNSAESMRDEASPFESTLTSLEFLVWGRQRDGGVLPPPTMISSPKSVDRDPLSRKQAIEVLKYHWKWLAWTHNMIHWPRFWEECQLYWNEGLINEKAWMALYYAILCVGLHHMTTEQRAELGFAPGPDIAAQLYHKCVDALKEADYAAVHSLTSVQSICLLVLCAHDFNGSNLLSVLLSSAIRIAQALNIHRLGRDPPEPLSYHDTLHREIQKSIWMFLSTQDWLMIPFSNAHSISPSYCTTPNPMNCNAIAGFPERTATIQNLPMEEQTLMSYQLIMFKVASVFRAFFDNTSCLPVANDPDTALRNLYNEVLKADSDLEIIVKSLPSYLRADYQDTSHQLPCYIPRQRYHLAISVAHKTLTIHRRFFIRSLTDRWYNYTKVTCVNCAKTVLTQFRSNSDESTSRNLWTILAHVVSASMILLLELIVSRGDCEEAASKRQLISDSLALLKNSNKSSSMSVRGIDLIELLLSYSTRGSMSSLAIPSREESVHAPDTCFGIGLSKNMNTNSLGQIDIKGIAAYLAMNKSAIDSAGSANVMGGDPNAFAGFDLGELDTWMQYFDVPTTH